MQHTGLKCAMLCMFNYNDPVHCEGFLIRYSQMDGYA